MHLFNINRLAGELRADALSETEKYRYLLGLVVLRALSEASRSAATQSRNHFADILSALLISLIGFHICHKINQRGDNQRLIERLICLSVPISIWGYLLSFALYYGGFIVTQTILGRAEALSIWAFFGSVGVLISGAFLTLHFGMMIYFLQQVVRPQATTPSAPLAMP